VKQDNNLKNISTLSGCFRVSGLSSRPANTVSILLTQEERFARLNLVKLDNNLKNYFHFWGTNEWLGLRLEMIGTVVLSAGAFFLVVLPSTRVDAGKFQWYACIFCFSVPCSVVGKEKGK
jgi:hypothetical protein